MQKWHEDDNEINDFPLVLFHIIDISCLVNLIVALVYNAWHGGTVINVGIKSIISENDPGEVFFGIPFVIGRVYMLASISIVGEVVNCSSTSSYRDKLKKKDSSKKAFVNKIIIIIINVIIAIGLWNEYVIFVLIEIAYIATPILVIGFIVAIIKAIGQSIHKKGP